MPRRFGGSRSVPEDLEADRECSPTAQTISLNEKPAQGARTKAADKIGEWIPLSARQVQSNEREVNKRC